MVKERSGTTGSSFIIKHSDVVFFLCWSHLNFYKRLRNNLSETFFASATRTSKNLFSSSSFNRSKSKVWGFPLFSSLSFHSALYFLWAGRGGEGLFHVFLSHFPRVARIQKISREIRKLLLFFHNHDDVLANSCSWSVATTIVEQVQITCNTLWLLSNVPTSTTYNTTYKGLCILARSVTMSRSAMRSRSGAVSRRRVIRCNKCDKMQLHTLMRSN